MAKDKYEWLIGNTPPELELHSRAKHELIYDYLVKYVAVLTTQPHIDRFRLTLVDGFAGGGLYSDHRGIQLGSPLLMMKAMTEAQVAAQSQRKKPFSLDAHFYFVELKKKTVDYLTHVLQNSHAETAAPWRASTTVLHGAFEDHLEAVLADVRARTRAHRVIFVLDQYGYKDAPMHLLRRIFASLDNAEVILTFAADWLIAYLSDSEQSKRIISNVGLGPIGKSIQQLKEGLPTEWRQTVQILLHREIFEKSGARFYTPFFIHSTEANRSYWLVHLSNHPKARDVMAELHWEKHNHFLHFGRAGLNQLGYHPQKDLEEQGFSLLPFRFDSFALAQTNHALGQDLPRRIHETGQIAVSELLAKITNETPATNAIILNVLRELSAEGELELIDEKGQKREAGVKQLPRDKVRIPSQGKLWKFGLDQ